MVLIVTFLKISLETQYGRLSSIDSHNAMQRKTKKEIKVAQFPSFSPFPPSSKKRFIIFNFYSPFKKQLSPLD